MNLTRASAEVHLIQSYVIKFCQRLTKGFFYVFWFPPPIKWTITEILLKVVLNNKLIEQIENQ